jgi:CheY-like chemotaxis protein
MAGTTMKLPIVDDDVSLRMLLSQILAEIGYSVQSAADGFAALSEIQREIPDILLSDLDMPGMSGSELLLEVHQRFPSIGPLAMSGAFAGNVVPPGVIAAAFYSKGSNLASLLLMVRRMDTTHCPSLSCFRGCTGINCSASDSREGANEGLLTRPGPWRLSR